jgi:hypothetical protein
MNLTTLIATEVIAAMVWIGVIICLAIFRNRVSSVNGPNSTQVAQRSHGKITRAGDPE